MQITLLGAGNVGMSLATAFINKGKTITFGVPNPDKYRPVVELLGNAASITTTADAIHSGELIILATPYSAADAIARSMPDWENRILVDATNPIAPGLSGLLLGTTTSGAEAIANAAKGARVIKAFNTTGAENMANSHFDKGIPFMPVCGDDIDARERVQALATLIGFDAVDCGELTAARYLEPFAMMWIHMAFKRGQGRQFAFSRIQR